ncbi:HD domain-containing phosphohydrolase [Maridesulfovibrio zosterae]|uniref:HD domain-containing phosphohydrolase n=1 Tax=Maridesulfovibrio zosterae TaxID=82171 RepID=UPI0004272C07|nr:HD domain-containing phosphohydrolase [Maridesulfovibrio zosterae]
MKKPRILFVDDEINILKSMKLLLRKDYDVDTAQGAVKALEMITTNAPYAVIISDLKMPSMDGIEFLHRVQKAVPESVRIMLTGHADVESASLAVNRGHVFRFLTKPIPNADMHRILEAAVNQYQLITSEKELLRGTLRGCIKVLTDILSVASPQSFSRSERIKHLAVKTAELLKMRNTLHLELAAMLSQLGCISLSETTLNKIHSGEKLSEQERVEFMDHPRIGAKLLSNIPRMDQVVEIISRQNEPAGENPDLPLEAKILKACLDFEEILRSGKTSGDALDVLSTRQGWYEQNVLKSLQQAVILEADYSSRKVPVKDLKPGMILDQNLYGPTGTLISTKGQEVGEASIMRIINIFKDKKSSDHIKVLESKSGSHL